MDDQRVAREGSKDAITPRRAVRAFILNGREEVLMMRIIGPAGEIFWVVPGGGIDDDETPEDALRRELREEMGLSGCEIGPLVWRRRHTFDWGGRRCCQHEEYRVVHAESFAARMLDETEGVWVDDMKWWRIEDLRVASERLTPLSIADIISDYLRSGAPLDLPSEEIVSD